jgi:uncharacterized protein YjeT (DUF2065 family)
MVWVLYAIGLIGIACGTSVIIYTDESKKVLSNVMVGSKRMLLAVVAVAVGVLLIMAASKTQHRGFVIFLGVLAMAKGGFIAVNPKQLYDRVADWYLTMASDETYRLHGIIMMVLCTILLSWIS